MKKKIGLIAILAAIIGVLIIATMALHERKKTEETLPVTTNIETTETSAAIDSIKQEEAEKEKLKKEDQEQAAKEEERIKKENEEKEAAIKAGIIKEREERIRKEQAAEEEKKRIQEEKERQEKETAEKIRQEKERLEKEQREKEQQAATTVEQKPQEPRVETFEETVPGTQNGVKRTKRTYYPDGTWTEGWEILQEVTTWN